MAKQKKFPLAELATFVTLLDENLDLVRDLQEMAEKDFDIGVSLDQVAALNRYAAALMALSNSLMTDLRRGSRT